MQGRWKEYVEMALERGAFRGVVSAACLMTPESVQWVVDGEECDSQLKEKGLVVYTWGAENNMRESASTRPRWVWMPLLRIVLCDDV